MGFSVLSRYKLQIGKNKMANGQFQVHYTIYYIGYVNTKNNTVLDFLYNGIINTIISY